MRICHMQFSQENDLHFSFTFIFMLLSFIYIIDMIHTYLIYKKLYKNPSNLIAKKGRETLHLISGTILFKYF